MEQRRTSRTRSRHYRFVDERLSPSDNSDKTERIHPSTSISYRHRNNHNCSSMPNDEVTSMIDDESHRKESTFAQRFYQNSSIISIYLSNFLLLLIRLMFLLLILLICSVIVYHLVNYLSPKPKNSTWERFYSSLFHWFIVD